ncbi:MAG TPA: TssQ family T6SS-associated lipoprotein [Burkholderiaceae bacterium]|nr:TssQ family T6SS-associated lipoprotein [Burkholderiaceae bacterium]
MLKRLAVIAAVLFITACETPNKPVALSDLMAQPAEQALLAGLRAYDEGLYPVAERELQRSLTLKLRAPRDVANANKYLAFIYCTSERLSACEKAFAAARAADPKFELSKAEAGHPQWGPVYRKVMGAS